MECLQIKMDGFNSSLYDNVNIFKDPGHNVATGI